MHAQTCHDNSSTPRGSADALTVLAFLFRDLSFSSAQWRFLLFLMHSAHITCMLHVWVYVCMSSEDNSLKEFGLRLLFASKVFSERHVQHEHVDITSMPSSHLQNPKKYVRHWPNNR